MAGNESPAMVLRVAAIRAPEGAFSPFELLFCNATPERVQNRLWPAECCPRHGAVRKSCTMDGPCEPSMLHEFVCTQVLRRGLKSNYLYKNSRFRNRQCPTKGNPRPTRNSCASKYPHRTYEPDGSIRRRRLAAQRRGLQEDPEP